MTELTDLRALKAENLRLENLKLEHEIKQEALRVESLQISLAATRDGEADRLAKVGSREFRQLDVNRPIYDRYVDEWIQRLEHWERRDEPGPILVRINSPGGSVFDGLALFDVLKRLSRKGFEITTHGTGMIASMATILMQAGDTRVLDANSWFMIHEVSAGAMGKSSEMEDALKLYKRLEDRLVSILSERSTLSKRQIISRTKRKDDWMNAEEAVALGFADRVE